MSKKTRNNWPQSSGFREQAAPASSQYFHCRGPNWQQEVEDSSVLLDKFPLWADQIASRIWSWLGSEVSLTILNPLPKPRITWIVYEDSKSFIYLLFLAYLKPRNHKRKSLFRKLVWFFEELEVVGVERSWEDTKQKQKQKSQQVLNLNSVKLPSPLYHVRLSSHRARSLEIFHSWSDEIQSKGIDVGLMTFEGLCRLNIGHGSLPDFSRFIKVFGTWGQKLKCSKSLDFHLSNGGEIKKKWSHMNEGNW